jgi:hypothetical protein
MSTLFRAVAVSCFVGGCAVSTPQQHPQPYYANLNCGQLHAEARRLAAQRTRRDEYLLEDAAANRKTAVAQLKAVRSAVDEKNC